MLWVVFPCLLSLLLAQSSPRLQIDLVKRNSSELSQTVLREPSVASFTGGASDLGTNATVGELVPFSPLDGCMPLVADPLLTETGPDGSLQFKSFSNSTSFVVLMQRGRCDYSTMFRNANRVGNVVGVLIYDPVHGGEYSNSLKISGPSQQFPPGLLISKTLGDDLRKKAMKYREVVNGEDAPWVRVEMSNADDDALEKFWTILAFTYAAFIVIGVVACLAYYIFAVCNHRNPNQDRNLPIPPTRKPEDIVIDDEFLAKLPKKAYKSPNSSPIDYDEPEKMKEQNLDCEETDYRQRMPHNETCPICLEEFQMGTEVNQLHCGHCYHPKCIIPWLLERSPECPLCKIDVRVSMIEAEELEFVRNLRQQQFHEMQEVVVATPDGLCLHSSASFESIPLKDEK